MKKIENEKFEVALAIHGAEPTSIKSKTTGREFLYDGRSPVLFPHIGRKRDNKITVDGKEFEAPSHGFAIRSDFQVVSHSENSVTFLLKDSDESKKYLPYKFEFYLTYKVEDNVIKACHEFRNTDSEKIYFSFGGHPGFNCNIGDSLVFEKNENATRLVLSKNHLISEIVPFFKNENEILLKDDTFANDTIILTNLQSEYVVLKPKNENWQVKFRFFNAPYVGFWSNPRDTFVCIEPWFGTDDYESDTDYEIKTKPGILSLGVGKSFVYEYHIEIQE